MIKTKTNKSTYRKWNAFCASAKLKKACADLLRFYRKNELRLDIFHGSFDYKYQLVIQGEEIAIYRYHFDTGMRGNFSDFVSIQDVVKDEKISQSVFIYKVKEALRCRGADI